MKINIHKTKQLGQMVKFARQVQGLDQASAGMLSGNGSTFMSEFENGKPTVQLARVLNTMESLGITITIDLPVKDASLTPKQRERLALILSEFE